MKKCTWCGKEYAEDLERCLVDGQPLADGQENAAAWYSPPEILNRRMAEVPQQAWATAGSSRWLDLSRMEGAFDFQEGYSRPNWKLIRTRIQQAVEVEHQGEAWAEAVAQWAEQLRTDLGGEYVVRCSPRFVLLSAQEPQRAGELLQFAQQALAEIYDWLKDAAWQWVHGPHVILLFEDEEDYYQYVAYYCQEGVHPASSGVLLHKDYVHIAMPDNGRNTRSALAHELVHNSVVHLPVPLWLNEGLAVSFERRTGARRSHVLDDDLLERHLVLWNRETIQSFWAGVSFRQPGEPNTLSYGLAEILIHLLFSERQGLPAFVKAAHYDDAGQTAALDVLGADLGQVAGTFLGPGDWRPKRKAMVACWKAARPARNTEPEQPDAEHA